MSYKKTYAFIRGTWDGVPGKSNFTQAPTVFATTREFTANYPVDSQLGELVDEYVVSGSVTQRTKELSADGKVKINTTEYTDQAAHDSYAADPRWGAESTLTKAYNVEEAPTPEDVNTFNEELGIYYHSSAHLF